MNKSFKIALAVGALAAAGGAYAATATGTFGVSTTVNTNCIATATAMGFAPYTPGVSVINQTSTVSVRCSPGTGYTVGLNAGTFPGALVTTRRMSNSGAPLDYGLYTDSGHTNNWGNTPGTDTQSGTGSGMGVPSATVFTVYGQIPESAGNLLATSGSFNDTITVNVVY